MSNANDRLTRSVRSISPTTSRTSTAKEYTNKANEFKPPEHPNYYQKQIDNMRSEFAKGYINTGDNAYMNLPDISAEANFKKARDKNNTGFIYEHKNSISKDRKHTI